MEERTSELGKDSMQKKLKEAEKMQCKNLIAVFEEPVHFNNIGKVIRCANTLGIEKLYVVDPKNKLPASWEEMRKHKPLIRMSASAVKWTCIQTFKTSTECLDALEKEQFVSIATSPHQKGKKNIRLQDGDYTQAKLAIWFGNESDGLSQEVIDRSDSCVYIDMFGIIESMNVSSSAAIVLYEITKQRRALKS